MRAAASRRACPRGEPRLQLPGRQRSEARPDSIARTGRRRSPAPTPAARAAAGSRRSAHRSPRTRPSPTTHPPARPTPAPRPWRTLHSPFFLVRPRPGRAIGRCLRAMSGIRSGSVIVSEGPADIAGAADRIRRVHVRLRRISPDRHTRPRSSALASAGIPQMSDIARDPRAARPVNVARTRYSPTDSRYHSRIPLTRIMRLPTLSP